MAKGLRLPCWPLPLCNYKSSKVGGSRIYKTGCRALLVKLGLGEENTSVREKKVTRWDIHGIPRESTE